MRCLAAALLLCSFGRSAAADNFSQHAGFAAYFAAHPPASQTANDHERALLRRYRPRLWIGPGQDAPIGFYADYIAHGTLYDRDGELISRHVNRALLNRHKHDPGAAFIHRATDDPTHPVVFAHVDHARLPCTSNWTFLTYHFVFRRSGLPEGLAFWKAWPLGLVVDLEDWHQLDHYTAASVVLNAAQRPVALLLQQHNDQRSYIFGADIALPANGRVRLTAALRSNELSPWAGTRARHRTVQFMSADSLRYLVTGDDKSLYASHDITDPTREIDYKLAFLPPDDAFYLFEGRLGAKRWLPGRSGPPGAAYHTLPMFLNRALQLVAFHWREGDTRQMRALRDFLQTSRERGTAATDSRAFDSLCTRFRMTVAGEREERRRLSGAGR